ncbi:sulfate permease [Cryobacterium sp. Hh11]|uniref:sulfate permease n=1 Tax=Cryobacterium sp. Hh11 TaxID=2555868 RepID=UPI001582A223|nr:sulfate permease [Cryobacterium sp. Hh11]
MAATDRSYFFLRRFMPTAIVIDAINTRRGLKWGVPAMLLAGPYAFSALFCRAQVDAGGPGWLNLLVILCLWNTLKLLLVGPISLVKLMAVRVREAVARRRTIRTLLADGVEHFNEPILLSRHG